MAWCIVPGRSRSTHATGNFVSDDIAEQTEQVLKNLNAVLESAAAGSTGL
jgi:enamine deaminase RidA (YjgF/YER057c/UK114 family)